MRMRIGMMAAFCGFIVFNACNNKTDEVNKLKSQVAQDSVQMAQMKGKDTVIANYINTLGEIQNNLDSLKVKQKILSMNEPENKADRKKAILDDIQAIDNALINNNNKINKLQKQLKKLQSKDAKMAKLIATLNAEIEKKNQEIVDLQNKLNAADASMDALNKRFNDSIAEISRQRESISQLTDSVNTVYYAVGTNKELKQKGVITKTGGVLGIGRTSQLNAQVHGGAFTKFDRRNLKSIVLDHKFGRLVTAHPGGSYTIEKGKKSDRFLITNTESFWSESKFLVIEEK